jgi:sugar phosphate isomerase/epimerase
MEDASNGALQAIKKRAFTLGLDLMGFSTHQDFVDPSADVRRENIRKTIADIEP